MSKSRFCIAGAVCAALLLSGCTTNPYTGESEAGKSGVGAGLGALVGAGVGVLSSSKHDRGKGALIGAAAGVRAGVSAPGRTHGGAAGLGQIVDSSRHGAPAQVP